MINLWNQTMNNHIIYRDPLILNTFLVLSLTDPPKNCPSHHINQFMAAQNAIKPSLIDKKMIWLVQYHQGSVILALSGSASPALSGSASPVSPE